MKHIFRSALDLISPRACHICGKRLAVTEEGICGVCNWHLPRTRFTENAEDNELARLFWGRFPIEKAASLFFYKPHDEPSQLIYDLKYHSKEYLGFWLGSLLAKEAQKSGFFADIDVIVPVPITLGRRWQRGYNQSERIAQGIHEVTGIPMVRNAIKRIRFSQSQTHLSSSERMDNVEGAFRLVNPQKVEGKHILLIDDIITTGATITVCAKELQKAGNVRFSVLSIGFTKN